jgi:hypothetical protein
VAEAPEGEEVEEEEAEVEGEEAEEEEEVEEEEEEERGVADDGAELLLVFIRLTRPPSPYLPLFTGTRRGSGGRSGEDGGVAVCEG